MSIVQGTVRSTRLNFAVTVGGAGTVLFPNGICTSSGFKAGTALNYLYGEFC